MKKIILTAVLAVFSTTALSQEMCKMPEFLKEGDAVAIIAPSYLQDQKVTTKACELLTEWGLRPVLSKNVEKYSYVDPYRGTIAPDKERLDDIEWAFNTDSLKAVICLRGGYGALHILDKIDRNAIKEHPKWFVGYSDITNIHMLTVKSGVMSIHGNMCGDLGKKGADDEGNMALKQLLFGSLPQYQLPFSFNNVKGSACGRLVGGNMITMEALFNTEFDLSSMGPIILFLEEVGESMHALDRFMNVLMRRDLSNVKGVILGDFTGVRPDLPYTCVEELMVHYFARLGVPVCCGFPGGHGKVNLPLIEGAVVNLDVSVDGSTITVVCLDRDFKPVPVVVPPAEDTVGQTSASNVASALEAGVKMNN